MSNQLARYMPDVHLIHDIPRTTSMNVATVFDRKHKNVLRDIENMDCSEGFTELNFEPSEYTDPTGRKLPMYEMTRDGFVFLVMGFTGSKAAAFKEAYINAFNVMESARRAGQEGTILRLQDRLIERLESLMDLQAQFKRKGSPLSEFDLHDIRAMLEAGASKPAIARATGRGLTTIRRIARQAWPHCSASSAISCRITANRR